MNMVRGCGGSGDGVEIMARPSKLTLEVQDRITDSVKTGVPFAAAARLAGVSEGTANEWLYRGKGKDKKRRITPQYAAFAVAIDKAHAVDEAEKVGAIDKAAKGGELVTEKVTIKTVTKSNGETMETKVEEKRMTVPNWQAAAWHLERRHAKDFGEKVPQVPLSERVIALVLLGERHDPLASRTQLKALSAGNEDP